MSSANPLDVLDAPVSTLRALVAAGGRSARTAAIALARRGDEQDLAWLLAHDDADVRVGALWGAGPSAIGHQRARGLLGDPDPLVVEAACWILGEVGDRDDVAVLVTSARVHEDLRVREAAIAALGSIGAPEGLDVVIDAARNDKPAVRRRAVVALCAFDDPRADRALRAAATDRDRQVRSVAADLLRDRGGLGVVDDEDTSGTPSGADPSPDASDRA
ncbi:PBS lyase HEAT domain protein repeat-containing protein [Acidimicrobium ferrooxidans DSM 10331]|uniref:PBS lyase HEAT domain protein repeat-containing protein n=1 Tax=Acidimicrobium ferrooxidans (strain DSM 10331 / JCM 15462 / NBRC 103882 / ICP) TaxID=525909 RepID=C7M1Q4_ACIFD|nr:HEAT repeat domain-containing protein [Acidimicrobium ferrooxidans]ACU54801.1 PBS lyase HEAT domain protein repeat-containing protein [Acidimicrobium ferrooxidans DSM 10331]